jgi:hypothetical protein
MRRSRAYYRWQRRRVIRKKVDVLKRIGGTESVLAWTRGQYGRLAKGKIHCSCRMCRTKSYDYLSHRDVKHLIAAAHQKEVE